MIFVTSENGLNGKEESEVNIDFVNEIFAYSRRCWGSKKFAYLILQNKLVL